ncbi:MAG: M56 family metallopeptidase, partial [Acetatifactor sp.]|nr:M56 family metallopeptidase [Acetatifactor sp.]
VSILNLFSSQQEAQSSAGVSLPGNSGNMKLIGAPEPELIQRPDIINAPHDREGLRPIQNHGTLPEKGGEKKEFSWQKLLLRVWAAGMAGTGIVLFGVNLSFWRRLRRARRLQAMEREAAVPVYVVEDLTGPCLFGLTHPAIYLPGGIAKEQLPYVLAHEESHYRMGDHIWSLLRSLCLIVHWYHPLVWLAVYVSRQDSELACDEKTIERLGEESRSAYGRVLVDVTVQQSRKADFLCCATAMTADGRSLRERVRRITHRPRTLALTGAVLAVLMVGIFCVACTGGRQENDSSRALESTQESSIEQSQHSGGSETQQDATDPAADHVRSDNAYYRVIRDTTIEDPYFTMEVPESLVGKVAYGVVLGQNEDGESYLRHLALFHVDSVSQLLEGEPQCGWNELAESGCLCYCFWMGYPDMGPELEDIAYRSGTWDIRGMEYLLSQGYDWIGGEGDSLVQAKQGNVSLAIVPVMGLGSLIQANQAGTGAYFYVEPTYVEYDPQSSGEYVTCLEELRTCWASFAVRTFPYEELEGYSTGDIPRWRQDFEEAERIFSWFTGMGEVPMSRYSATKEYKDIDNKCYGVVDVPGISTMQELRDYMNRYFPSDITEALLSGEKPTLNNKGEGVLPFVEEDGVLYGMAGGVGLYQYTDAERQYAVWFEEIDGRQIAYIHLDCQCSWSMLPGDTIPWARILYTMEEQEDGSWHIVGRYELPISLTLEEAAQYGTYVAIVDGRHYTLTLDRRKKFWLYDMASSLAIIDNDDNWFYWEDDMLVLKFGDSDKAWYFQRELGWNVKFREDLSTFEEGDPLPDGTVFERIM